MIEDELIGLIVASYGRQFIVEVEGNSYQAVTKSKKTEYVVGDKVILNQINQQQVQIIDLLPRHNLIYRSDKNRSKIIASNISQLLIVIAVKPNFNINFLNSALLTAEQEAITPIIVVNKSDLLESEAFIDDINNLYHKQLGYAVINLTAVNSCDILKPYLIDQASLLIGQSGVGKSTITNQIIAKAKRKTNDINKAETSGCHTTSNAMLYHIDATATLIDCPGLQEFGLYHIEKEHLIYLFPELKSYVNQCKFRNCQHQNEPECVIVEVLNKGKIAKTRFEFFQALNKKLNQKLNY